MTLEVILKKKNDTGSNIAEGSLERGNKPTMYSLYHDNNIMGTQTISKIQEYLSKQTWLKMVGFFTRDIDGDTQLKRKQYR